MWEWILVGIGILILSALFIWWIVTEPKPPPKKSLPPPITTDFLTEKPSPEPSFIRFTIYTTVPATIHLGDIFSSEINSYSPFQVKLSLPPESIIVINAQGKGDPSGVCFLVEKYLNSEWTRLIWSGNVPDVCTHPESFSILKTTIKILGGKLLNHLLENQCQLIWGDYGFGGETFAFATVLD